MGQVSSTSRRRAAYLFDCGNLEAAHKEYLALSAAEIPESAPSDVLLQAYLAKSEISMNLGLIAMCRNQFALADKYFLESIRYDIPQDDAVVRTYINPLAIFHRAVLFCADPDESRLLTIKSMMSSYWNTQALSANIEQYIHTACVVTWMYYLLKLGTRYPLSLLAQAEMAYNQREYVPVSAVHLSPVSAYGLDDNLEISALDNDLEESDMVSDGKNEGTGDRLSSQRFEAVKSTVNQNTSIKEKNEARHRSNPNIEFMRAICMYRQGTVELMQVQAQVQASRVLAMYQSEEMFNGGEPPLHNIWKARGKVFESTGQLNAASAAYTIALATNWTNVPAWFDLASIYEKTGQHERSRILFRCLTELLAPDSVEAWMGRGNSCMIHRRFREAAICYDRVILDLNPALASAWERRACTTLELCKWNTKALNETLSLCKMALKLNPSYILTHRTRAQALFEMRQYQEALEEFEYVLRFDSKDVESLHGCATSLRQLFRYSEAVKYYTKALNQHSKALIDISLHLAITYLSCIMDVHSPFKDHLEIKECIDSGLEATEVCLESHYKSDNSHLQHINHHYFPPSALPWNRMFYGHDEPEAVTVSLQQKHIMSQVWIVRVKLLAYGNRPLEAINASNRAIQANPSYPGPAWMCRGDLWILLKKPVDEAISCYLKALTYDSQNEEIYRDIIEAYRSIEAYDKALEYSLKLLDLVHKDRLERFADAILNHADLLLKMNKNKELLAFCEPYFEAEINSKILLEFGVSFSFPKGSNHVKKNSFDQYSSVVTFTNRQKLFLLYLVSTALIHLGRYEESIECCIYGLTLNPSKAKFWIQLGRSYFLEDRCQEALKCFDRVSKPSHMTESSCYRGLCLYRLGAVKKSLEIFNEVELDSKELENWIIHLSPTERAWYHDIITAAMKNDIHPS